MTEHMRAATKREPKVSPQVAIADAEELEAGTNFGIVVCVTVQPALLVEQLLRRGF